jgi:hypothetical protein
MPDNPHPTKSGSLPPLPSSGMTGKLPSPTTQLPVRRGGAGKIVVMLSSVAKAPPGGVQALPRIPAPPFVSAKAPPPLPPKQVVLRHDDHAAPPGRLTVTTHVKLPPKTSLPRLSTLSGIPIETPVPPQREAPVNKAPPPLPKKSGAQHIPPIKLNEPSSPNEVLAESIFPEAVPVQPAASVPAEESRAKPPPPMSPSQARKKPAPLVTPPSLPPPRVETPPPLAQAAPELRPPPLPPPLPAMLQPAPASPLHLAPRMLEQPPELPSEKLPQPHLPDEIRRPCPSRPVSTRCRR